MSPHMSVRSCVAQGTAGVRRSGEWARGCRLEPSVPELPHLHLHLKLCILSIKSEPGLLGHCECVFVKFGG